jgi:hypothetical protein
MRRGAAHWTHKEAVFEEKPKGPPEWSPLDLIDADNEKV